MIILFTDMFQNGEKEKLFNALQHLKHNKHRVVIFHVFDSKSELHFNYDNSPRKFIDLETNMEINVFADNLQEEYEKKVKEYFQEIALTCAQNKIKYVPVAVSDDFEKVLTTYLIEKQMFG
jgi:hypothetical protein